MGDISFSPTFHHKDWVDDVDRVEAAGPNGFNLRFRAIHSDLRQVSTVVGQIGATLDSIVANPAPRPQRLTLAPLLRATPFSPAWTITAFGAAQAPSGVKPVGVLNLALPDGATLVSLRAIGQANGTTVQVTLVREPIQAVASGAEPLVMVTGDANTYDRTAAVDPATSVIDGLNFRYFISATSAAASASSPVTVAALQIDYLTT